MMVEAALRDVELAGDPLHRCAAIAELVDQPGGGEEKCLAPIDRIVRQIHGPRHPARTGRGKPMAEHIHDARFDPTELIHVVTRQPYREPECVLHENVGPRAVEIGLRTGCGWPPEAARAAEYFAPAAHQPAAHRILHRAQIRQAGDLALLAALYAGQASHVEREIALDSRLGRGRFGRRVQHYQQVIERMLERRGGKILLALEIISDAGGIEPHAARHVRKGHALCALFVDGIGRGSEDRFALRPKAARADLLSVAVGFPLDLHQTVIAELFRRNSPFCTCLHQRHSSCGNR